MNINEYMENAPLEDFGPLAVREHVVCADGFTLSVQASDFHYCTPRSKEGPKSSNGAFSMYSLMFI